VSKGEEEVMLALRGTYDGKRIKLSEEVKLEGKSEVIVTFLDKLVKSKTEAIQKDTGIFSSN
jgi:hypothetical protein